MGQPQVDLQGQTFSDLLEEADYDYSRPKRGQVSRATVLAMTSNGWTSHF